MSKSELLLKSITKFYEDEKNAEMLLDVLQHRKGLSLRNLEHFVTNHSKATNLTFTTKGRPFTVHVAYKSSLDGYSKKLFDPFCRTERINFKVADQEIVTTVAQLNFIRWCITNDIIHYLTKYRQSLNSRPESSESCIHSSIHTCCTAG